jgi:hypothetical protein
MTASKTQKKRLRIRRKRLRHLSKKKTQWKKSKA